MKNALPWIIDAVGISTLIAALALAYVVSRI